MGIASIMIQSEDSGLAQALGHVVASAIQQVGFTDVNVLHHDDLDSDGVSQTDFEGPSLLQAIKMSNPGLLEDTRIDITSFVAEAWSNRVEPEEESDDEVVDDVAAAHLAEIAQDNDS